MYPKLFFKESLIAFILSRKYPKLVKLLEVNMIDVGSQTAMSCERERKAA